jgi:hypothetical protein
MMALLGSSLLNLGIIFLIFSVIIYIVKNKLSDMDKKITSITTIMEETIKTINTQNTITRVAPTEVKLEKTVVSDDENSDDEDSDDDDESYKLFCSIKNDKLGDDDDDSSDDDDADDNNIIVKEVLSNKITVKEVLSNNVDYTQLTQDIEKEPLLDEVKLLQSNPGADPVLEMTFQSYDSIDDTIAVKSHTDDFNNTPGSGVFKEKEKEKEEEDYNLLNVKELKKLVSEKGGKVSGKIKEELILYLNENKE